jgi:hypothetical protein
MWKFTPAPHKGQVHRRRVERAAKKEVRREDRAVRRVERAVSGEKGPPVDWNASTTGAQQFPSNWPNAPEPVAGVGRTLRRGLQ